MALAITDHVRKSPCVAAVGITFAQSCWDTEVTRLRGDTRSTAVNVTCMNWAAVHARSGGAIIKVQPG